MEIPKKIIWKKINLREINLNDAKSINENVNFEDICIPTHIPFPQKLQDTKNFIIRSEEEIKTWKTFQFWIENKDNGKIIWMIGLNDIDLNNSKTVVWYWIWKDYRRQWFTKEALEVILSIAFNNFNLNRVAANIDTYNEKSYKLLETLKFKREWISRSVFRRDDWEFVDNFVYSILRKEYFENKL